MRPSFQYILLFTSKRASMRPAMSPWSIEKSPSESSDHPSSLIIGCFEAKLDSLLNFKGAHPSSSLMLFFLIFASNEVPSSPYDSGGILKMRYEEYVRLNRCFNLATDPRMSNQHTRLKRATSLDLIQKK